jgi:preprotein translocase subunit YajC
MLEALVIFAQEAEKKGGGSPLDAFGLPFIFLIVIMLYFFIVLIPGKRRQERERQAMISNVTKGDEVLTSVGIYGTFVSAHETKDEVVIKVDDGTRLRMTRGSIVRNLSAEERAKAQKTQAAAPTSTAIKEQK